MIRRSIRFSLLSAGVLLAPIDHAVAYDDVKAIDVLVDGQKYVGKDIRVSGCDLSHASVESVLCHVLNDRKKEVGSIYVDGRTIDRVTMRRLLQECDDWFERPKRCRNVTLEGTLEAHPMLVEPRMVNTKITFKH